MVTHYSEGVAFLDHWHHDFKNAAYDRISFAMSVDIADNVVSVGGVFRIGSTVNHLVLIDKSLVSVRKHNEDQPQPAVVRPLPMTESSPTPNGVNGKRELAQ